MILEIYARTDTFDNSIIFASIQIWNDFSNDSKMTTSYKEFRIITITKIEQKVLYNGFTRVLNIAHVQVRINCSYIIVIAQIAARLQLTIFRLQLLFCCVRLYSSVFRRTQFSLVLLRQWWYFFSQHGEGYIWRIAVIQHHDTRLMLSEQDGDPEREEKSGTEIQR